MASAQDTSAPKPPLSAGSDTISASQPVALEVRVIASGARPAGASGERELFTEATSTVLVSENGAVIRLSAAVIPGQLLFLINQDSRREVVAQVLRKRYFRPTNCYVELQFTEPAAGFWGMEFSAEIASNRTKSQQSDAVRQVQSAEATADDTGRPAPPPSAQEVRKLKQEVDLLRDQLKSLLPHGAANVPATEALPVSNQVPASQELPSDYPKTSRLPIEPDLPAAKSDLPDPDSQPYSSIRNLSSSAPVRRSSNLSAPAGGNSFARVIPLAAGLLLLAAGAAWYANLLPGFPLPKFSAASSSSASELNVRATTPVANHPSSQNPDRLAGTDHPSKSEASNPQAVTASAANDHSTPAITAHSIESPDPPEVPPVEALTSSLASAQVKKEVAVVNRAKHAAPASSGRTAFNAPASAEQSDIVPPRLLTAVQSIAPPEAVRGFVAGNVIVDVVVGPTGRVISSTVISGRPSLRASALETLKQYRYRPATQNGRPVSAHVTLTIQCWFEP